MALFFEINGENLVNILADKMKFKLDTKMITNLNTNETWNFKNDKQNDII